LKVLFDQGTPVPLRGHISAHHVSTAYELGWATLKNGELLAAAEKSGFEVLVTTDTNLQYQQNLNQRKITNVVLSTTSWPRIKKNITAII
jgi:glutamate racemase